MALAHPQEWWWVLLGVAGHMGDLLRQRPEIAKDRWPLSVGNHGDLLGRILSFFSQRN